MRQHKRNRSSERIGRAAFGVCVAICGYAPASQANKSGVPIPKPPSFSRNDPAKYGKQLASYADRYDAGWRDSYSKSKMTLYDARGDSVTREVIQLILEGNDRGDKAIVKFLRPVDIRGVAALTHEKPGGTDDNWLYLPASRRVRRISGANRTASFQGTEFTYEDLTRVEVRKYRWKFLDETELNNDGKKHPVYRLEAHPTYKDTGYSKIIVHLHRKHWRPEQIHYYDRAGRLLKRLNNGKYVLLHGRFWRPARIEMVNAQTKKRTVIESKSMLLNLALYKKKNGEPRKNLTAAQFTRAAIEGR